jgi:hydrogenase maturation protease
MTMATSLWPPAGAEQKAARLRVIGCGNALAGDDGVGWELVARLRETAHGYNCEFRTVLQAGPELLDLLRDTDAVLFVDAVLSGLPAGTVHLIPLLPSACLQVRPLSALSTHGWGLGETLNLARSLGQALPRVMLLGIELESVEMGAPRTPAVEQAMAQVVVSFPQLLSRLADPESDAWSGPQLSTMP